MLGFIFQRSKDFKNPKTFLYLYKTLIRPSLEYSSTTWNPHYMADKVSLEKIQNKFLKFLNRKFPQNKNYENLCSKFKLTSLESRRDKRLYVYL